jgi:hypothetical protein
LDAPVAPGRPTDWWNHGGRQKDGETLQIQFNTALQSSPDAIGLISWNEFSENSHIEPSENYGQRYLDVLTNIRDVPAPVVQNYDSSEPGDILNDPGASRAIALGSIGLLTVISLVILVRRTTR